MHATESLEEADRLMTVCNSCRYCEGLCAVFPAMEMRRSFGDGDLNYLANLCHACGACYFDCQFSPPHEFDVNVPKTFAAVRAESYAAYAWPRSFAGLFRRNGVTLAMAAAAGFALFFFGFVFVDGPATAFAAHRGPGAFYVLMTHAFMASLFGAAFVYAIFAMGVGVANFWRDIGEPGATLREPQSLLAALRDAAHLRYLDGGGVGCYNEGEQPTDRRKTYHHFTFYGFLLCFASTCVATIYHYFGREAPYAWYDLPVILGTIGGIGLVIGATGLLVERSRRDRALRDKGRSGMDIGFILMLLLVALTGLALLVLRDTPLMGALLALHLGAVLGFFLTMPYGKFVHGIYRYAALVRYAKERRAIASSPEAG